MRKLSIFAKLFLSVFLVASLCLLVLGVQVYITEKNALIQRTCEQLRSVNILKKTSLEKRLQDDEKFIWHFIRKVMLQNGQSPVSPSSEFHSHKDFLKDFCKDYGHVDVMLLDENEQAIDSIFEGNNYTDTLARNKFTFVRVFLIDGTHYRLALVSGTGYLQKLLFENTGMGNTGETYLVGEDKKMISLSRFYPGRPPSSIIVNTPSVSLALENRNGTTLIKDYRGVEVLSAYNLMQHADLKWAIISEIDESEAMQPVLELRKILLFVGMLLLLVAFAVAFLLGRLIVSPIRQVSAGMMNLSKGLIPPRLAPPFYDNEESQMKLALNALIQSFEGITNFASEIGHGNLSADFKPLGDRDELSKSLINMRDQLLEYREKEKNLRRQRTLSLLEGQENERRRIAMDLHDGLGQWLTGIKLKIAVLELPPAQKEDLKNMVAETINETRRITNNLMPNTLVDFGLDSAVRQLISQVESNSEIEVDYLYLANNKLLPFEINLTLYRIIQEAMNNIQKHSQAKNVVLNIEETEQEIVLEIQDDGIGIPVKYNSGSGLSNMEERTRLIQGTFQLERMNPGTRILVRIPLN